ncbi:MAG: hypothetical protein Q7S01_06555 [bacterium]|nr:hypothetical protein [bacterium]
MAETPVPEKSGMFSNILAVAGLVILIGIIVWGASNLALFSGSWFSSFSSILSSSKSIKLTVPTKNIPSGEQFTVSWKYNPAGTGTYAFLYQCREGFQFKTTSPDNKQIVIPCGVGYTMLSTDNKFAVTPYLTGTSTVKVPLSVIFISSAPVTPGKTVAQPQGNATVTVVGAGTAPVETSPVTESAPAVETQPQTITAPSTTGVADLSVRILSTGVIDPISGNIIPREPVSPNDLVAVRFLITNASGSSTGPWYFTAQLPTSPMYPYTSPAQTSLAPGASIENMLRFKNAVPGGLFSVSLDPVNEVKESNEGNNSASVSI